MFMEHPDMLDSKTNLESSLLDTPSSLNGPSVHCTSLPSTFLDAWVQSKNMLIHPQLLSWFPPWLPCVSTYVSLSLLTGYFLFFNPAPHNTSLSTFSINPSIWTVLVIFLSTLHFLTSTCSYGLRRSSPQRNKFVLVSSLCAQLYKVKMSHDYLCFESACTLPQLGKTEYISFVTVWPANKVSLCSVFCEI